MLNRVEYWQAQYRQALRVTRNNPCNDSDTADRLAIEYADSRTVTLYGSETGVRPWEPFSFGSQRLAE